MTRITVALATVALLIPSAHARGQDAALMAEVQQVIESATAQQLPVDRIRERAAYGIAFGSDRPLILKTVRLEQERLRTARRLLGTAAPDLDISEGAKALQYVPESSISAVRKARPVGSVAAPLGILTQMIAETANPKRATDWLVRLMQRQATDVQLAAYAADVLNNRKRGMSVDDALTVHMKYVAALGASPVSAAMAAEALSQGPLTGSSSDPGLKSTVPPTTVKPPGGKPPRT
jgi:hypothetical protein